MKTGFTCAAGFNVVASAYRDGRRLVTVILGAPNVAARTAKAAALFDRGFAGIDRPSSSVVALPASGNGSPPDMRNEVCRNRGRLVAAFNSEVEQLDAPLVNAPQGSSGLFGAPAPRPVVMATVINSIHPPPAEPVPVHVGAEPGYAGLVAQARPPHSPLGTEPDPAAIAYAPSPAVAGSPLGVDPTALPLRGRARIARTVRAGRARTLKAAAEAPATKVIADAPGKGEDTPADGKKAARPVKAAAKARADTKVHPAAESGRHGKAGGPDDEADKPQEASPSPPRRAGKVAAKKAAVDKGTPAREGLTKDAKVKG